MDTYRLPQTTISVPCRVIARRTTETGRRVADIAISAEHSGLTKGGVPQGLELTVAERSVTSE